MSLKHQVQFVHGKKKSRNELRLPQLHFVACDDWMEKLGERAFCAWLKFYSWADRSDTQREADTIPNSMNKIAKRLGVSKTTFYETVIRPLWNYGFIDLIETEYKGYSFVNIVVYEYPCNDPDRDTKPLKKIRDYDTEYVSAARAKSLHTAQQRVDDTQSKNWTAPPSPENGLPPVQKIDCPSPNFGHNNVLNLSNDYESSNMNEWMNEESAPLSDQPHEEPQDPFLAELWIQLDNLYHKENEPDGRKLFRSIYAMLKKQFPDSLNPEILPIAVSIYNQKRQVEHTFLGRPQNAENPTGIFYYAYLEAIDIWRAQSFERKKRLSKSD